MSGALVLDSEGPGKAVQRDREVHEWLSAARDADLPVVTSAVAPVEVTHPKINDAALRWTLSRVRVEPVAQAPAQSAAALQYHGRVTILTSGVEDIGLLAAGHPRVVAEKV
ncbi:MULTISPECIES: hypothetical protein [unclassified Streptomyces]|uniref:hypothetical protein n=1 Tax=unclassified Streptomyces TaxID=2593676 RepID=UPI0005A84A86|nr:MULTISPECIES: hypothetical protein [unclassified Streptomyces]ODA75715.1 hypothetical protein APS67_000278 [Streptomyces sp. AVP053U2]